MAPLSFLFPSRGSRGSEKHEPAYSCAGNEMFCGIIFVGPAPLSLSFPSTSPPTVLTSARRPGGSLSFSSPSDRSNNPRASHSLQLLTHLRHLIPRQDLIVSCCQVLVFLPNLVEVRISRDSAARDARIAGLRGHLHLAGGVRRAANVALRE